MGLKHNNPNGEIVLASNLNLVKQFFWKLWELHLEINPISYFFKKMLGLPPKKLFITFTSLIQMEWIRASNVDKKYIFIRIKK